MKGIFEDYPELGSFHIKEGKCVGHKGRLYCWVKMHKNGTVKLSDETLNDFQIDKGARLLSLRGSDIAFVLAVKGSIIEAANHYKGKIAIAISGT